PRIEDRGDSGVLQRRQGLALGLESLQHALPGPLVHARPEHLERYIALDGLGLAREEDLGEAALADLVLVVVASQPRRGRGVGLRRAAGIRGHVQADAALEKAPGPAVRSEQTHDTAAQVRIAGALGL